MLLKPHYLTLLNSYRKFGLNKNKMKTLIIVLKVLLLPLITLGQAQNIPSVSLKTMDDRTVKSSDIIKDGQYTVIYFFNSNSKDLADHFEYLENLSSNYCDEADINIVAVYNAGNVNYNQVKPLLEGNDIDVKTYIDLNGEFQRSLGLASNSAYLILEPGRESTYYYSEPVDYIGSIDDQEFPVVYNSNAH
jgi:hypothetical protein